MEKAAVIVTHPPSSKHNKTRDTTRHKTQQDRNTNNTGPPCPHDGLFLHWPCLGLGEVLGGEVPVVVDPAGAVLAGVA